MLCKTLWLAAHLALVHRLGERHEPLDASLEGTAAA
jgi:hypothetical protein